jgi:hypothetical protein
MSAPDPFRFGGTDPLIALGAERLRRLAEMDAPGQEDDVTPEEHAALNAVEDQMEALVPISRAGAAVLVRWLKHRMQVYEWCELDDQVADNLVVWLERGQQE